MGLGGVREHANGGKSVRWYSQRIGPGDGHDRGMCQRLPGQRAHSVVRRQLIARIAPAAAFGRGGLHQAQVLHMGQ